MRKNMRRLSLIAIAALFAVCGTQPGAAAPVSPELQAAADICYGKEKINWAQLAEACSTVLAAPKLPPGRQASAYYNRGTAALHLGGGQNAYDDFTSALRLKPNFVLALESRGSILVGQQKFDLAIADLSKAITLSPRSSGAYNNRAMAYVGKGDTVKAMADFDKAVALAPNDGAAYSARGSAYAMAGQNDKAMADFNKAIALNPKLTVAVFNRGKLYAGKGDKARAKADFEAVLAITPDDARAKDALKALDAGG
jgi:tetratricopeptide (TPR) repeat protein